MKRWITRLIYGLLFAIPLMLVSFAIANASPQIQAEQPKSLDCAQCHPTFQQAWESGAHGKAVEDPVFKTAWEAQNNPTECLKCHTTGFNPDTGTYISEGITCQGCHGETPANHPMEPHKMDRSSKMCGNCHTETYFEWQVSSHRSKGVECVSCHDPHGTSMKTQDSSALCASCHKERSSRFSHSGHSEKGLVCADCHLAKLEITGEGHARRDHSFNVRLSTCNTCHSYQMHDASQVHAVDTTTAAPDAWAAVETASVASEPKSAGPIGFASLSGLVGLAAGFILAPWLERLHRRNKSDEDRG